jgi:predicted nucleotide-binding protein
MREAVARVVQQLDFEPVILHEQANQGRTLIEKFEDHSETAKFAIILLSGDDEGRALRDSGANLKPRARQNVILELGYFAGRLGRKRVCALMRGEVDLPSDIVGVVYEPFDPGGAWRFKLATELRAAGYTVDLNRLVS